MLHLVGYQLVFVGLVHQLTADIRLVRLYHHGRGSHGNSFVLRYSGKQRQPIDDDLSHVRSHGPVHPDRPANQLQVASRVMRVDEHRILPTLSGDSVRFFNFSVALRHHRTSTF